jgi:hypothetical protein
MVFELPIEPGTETLELEEIQDYGFLSLDVWGFDAAMVSRGIEEKVTLIHT